MPHYTRHVSKENGLVVPVTLGNPYADIVDERLAPITIDAILDTGANRTMIQTTVAVRLMLPILGAEPVGSVHSASWCKVYWAKLGFWFGDEFVDLDDQSVIGGLDPEFGCPCLIGRNILDLGILIYNGKRESFVFGF